MRTILTPIVPALLLLVCVTGLSAQQIQPPTVPRLLRISSSFHPASGLPVAPVESVTLSVYREEQGGTPLWQETQNVTIDADGRYTVLMGGTLNEGVPLDLFNSGEPRWLGVQFNRPGETEQPRVRMASVAYALKASDAETLGGKPASAYMLAPSLGNDPQSPAESRTASSETLNPKAAKPKAITGTPTMNSIVKFTDSSG
ncbi:MAG: hypothetical protein JO099_02635, partial [Acidobacteriia bacterium]|nr:hypothetical protein [Terriglobia bacterium]